MTFSLRIFVEFRPAFTSQNSLNFGTTQTTMYQAELLEDQREGGPVKIFVKIWMDCRIWSTGKDTLPTDTECML